jgi:hypothetical protein
MYIPKSDSIWKKIKNFLFRKKSDPLYKMDVVSMDKDGFTLNLEDPCKEVECGYIAATSKEFISKGPFRRPKKIPKFGTIDWQ